MGDGSSGMSDLLWWEWRRASRGFSCSQWLSRRLFNALVPEHGTACGAIVSRGLQAMLMWY